MPRVPTQDNFQTSPTAAPVREFQAPAIRNFGAEGLQEAGRGLMQAGAGLAKIQIEKQDEADQIRVLEAEDELERARLRLLYDPQDGALQKKGRDALSPGDRPLTAMYGERFDKAVSELESKLGNDRQKAAFRAAALRRGTALRGDLTRHVAREFERHREGVLTGAAETAVQGAAAEWGNVDRVAEHAARARLAGGRLAIARGLSGTEGKQLELAAVSKVHEAVIANALVAKQVDYAREYMTQNMGELDADARLRLTQALERGAKDEQVFTHVDRIWSSHRGNLSGALSAARNSVPADIRSEVEQRLRQYNADAKAGRAEGERRVKDVAWDHIANGGTVESLPSNVRNGLDGDDFLRMQDYEERRAARREAEARRAFEPDLQIYSNLVNESAEAPWSFTQRNLSEYVPRLGESLVRTLIEKQGAIGRKDAKAMEQGNIIKRGKALGRDLLIQHGLKITGTPSKREAEELVQFESALIRSVDERQSALERPLTDAEMRSEVAGLVERFVRRDSGLWGIGREELPAFQIPPGEEAQFVKRVYDDIPVKTRVLLEQQLATRFPGGIPPEEVENLYRLGVLSEVIDDSTGLLR